MTRSQQKSDEMFVSNFFIERLNKHYGLDYFPEENKNEHGDNSFIDSFARSKSKKHPLIKMQLTTCDDIDLHRFLNKSNKYWKDLEEGEEIEAPLAVRRRTGADLVNLINTAISKKTCKKDEILVLHNDFAIEI